MTPEPTTAEKMHGLRWSYAHNALNAVFYQFTFGQTILVLFLDELQMAKGQIGFIQSLFPFCGLLALVIAPWVARFGFKRTYIIFYGARKFIMATLLLTPWVVYHWGAHAAFIYVAAVMLIFAISRAIAETGYYPWSQEFVPIFIRGKYSAVSSIIVGITQFAAILMASFLIGRSGGLDRFMWLIGIGVVFGLGSVTCGMFIPGGAPVRDEKTGTPHFAGVAAPLRDRNFLYFLGGVAFVALAMWPLGSFVPLFMKEQVGLDEQRILLLQAATLFGALSSSYLWGWAADRYGSKPIMFSGLFITLTLPIAWILMPRHTGASLYVALAIAVVWGIADAAAGIGGARLLLNSIVPTQKKTRYMAIYYAWMGLLGGIGPLIAGFALDHLKMRISPVSFHLFHLDIYTPIFIASLVLLILGLLLYKRVRADSATSTSDFVRMWVRVDPLMALESNIRYSFAADEGERVSTTRRMGDARSPLNVNELVQALRDPSFNVRYEAIVAISRTRADERLIEALSRVLAAGEPELAMASAWALGRLGDPRGMAPLRVALVSGYPSLRAQAARSLATLGDMQIAEPLLRSFREESDKGVRLAYASALGKLGVREAAADLLAFLRGLDDESLRMEMTLAIVRLAGEEQRFVRVWRQAQSHPGIALSQATSDVAKRIKESDLRQTAGLLKLDECAEAFAREEFARGAALLADAARELLRHPLAEPLPAMLRECVVRLDEHHEGRTDYLLLTLDMMAAAVDDMEMCRARAERK
jgi:HEAT repeat protein/MFS family permease